MASLPVHSRAVPACFCPALVEFVGSTGADSYHKLTQFEVLRMLRNAR